MARKPHALCLLLVLFLPLLAAAGDLPTPPDGFEWHSVGKFNCSVLRPKGWVIVTEAGDSAFTVMVRHPEWVENPKRGAFTLTVITCGLGGRTVDEYVEAWEYVMKLGLVSLKTWPTEAASFVGRAGLFRWPGESEDPAQALAGVAVNRQTETVYVSMFVATVSSWAEDWKYGKPMVAMIAFDDEY